MGKRFKKLDESLARFKKLDESLARSQWELRDLFRAEGVDKMHCQKCNDRLSFWKMIYHAIGKKKGQSYFIACSKCRFINEIKKGEIGQKLDEFYYENKEDDL